LPELNTHSFIIKIWLEETAEGGDQAVWRGHITHVPSGERRYVQHTDEITAFIVPYLQSMGVKLDRRWWMRQRLHHLKLRLMRQG
jgi:hypothetical protein